MAQKKRPIASRRGRADGRSGSSANASREKARKTSRAVTAQSTRAKQRAHKKPQRPDRPPSAIRRVCLLTGGGDAPGLNAVIRAFVKTSVEHGISVLGSEDGFEGLIQPRPLVPLDRRAVRGILPRGGSILGCSNRANPFAYPIEHGHGRTSYEDVSKRVIERLKGEDVDALVLIGGDGTMNMALRLVAMDVPVIGIPKTIDNDLGATDVTFGFDTAVETATWAIDALHSTAEAHDRVMILELMGRYAGWISLAAGIAGGADVILIPEIPYDTDRVVAKILERTRANIAFSIVVIGEGAHPAGGAIATIAKGSKGHLPRLGGAANMLASELGGRVPHEIRTTVLGHIQRGGSPSAFDRVLGSRFGVHAANLCHAGNTGFMVALSGTSVVSVPLVDAVGRAKLVDPHGDLAETARSLGIELGAP